MDIISYHHNLDDQILVKLRNQDKAASINGNVARWLTAVEGIVTVQQDDQKNELAIVFDKQRIDALSILNLLGYSGPFIGVRRTRTVPEPV